MDAKFIFDWRAIVALGASAVSFILVIKMDSDAVEVVSTKIVDAVKECVIAFNSNH